MEVEEECQGTSSLGLMMLLHGGGICKNCMEKRILPCNTSFCQITLVASQPQVSKPTKVSPEHVPAESDGKGDYLWGCALEACRNTAPGMKTCTAPPGSFAGSHCIAVECLSPLAVGSPEKLGAVIWGEKLQPFRDKNH